MRLEWSQAALGQLNVIRRYIAGRNPAAAAKVQSRIVDASALLAQRPFIGRLGRVSGTREFVFTDIPYIAVYEVDETRRQVTILRVFHTARQYPPLDES